MTAYRSFGAALALGTLCACSSAGPPHPSGWTKRSDDTWSTTTALGLEKYSYEKSPAQGSLTDLSSSQAIDTVERYAGSRLRETVPLPACPGEAGLSTYSLPANRTLEVGFSINSGQAIVVRYERPSGVKAAPSVVTAFRQAVCYTL